MTATLAWLPLSPLRPCAMSLRRNTSVMRLTPAGGPSLSFPRSAWERGGRGAGGEPLQQVAHLLALRRQVTAVVLVGRDLDRHALDDAQPVAVDPDHLLGVVRQQPDLPHAEVDQDLCADAVVPQVRAEAEPLVR